MSRPLPPSLYADTAPPAPPCLPLAGAATADVAVIGGGFTGLSCALHLAEAGVQVVLLEANEIGWGASGRNGGQVNPGLKLAPAELEAAFGAKDGQRLLELGAAGPDLVFDLIARHGITCAARRGGTLRAVKSPRQIGIARKLADDYAARGTPVRYLEAGEVTQMTGTTRYHGAVFDPRGGAVNPLAYARGLARAAQSAGAVIHTGSSVTALIAVPAGWRLTTPGGSLTARHVALCANAYQGGLIPGLAASQVPVYSMITATAPLPEPLRSQVMPSDSVLYEQADITVYYRLDEEGRLLMGGRSPSRELQAGDTAFLRRYAERLWPDLRGVAWTHDWNGQLAMTLDHLPHVHEPARGLMAVLGCNGRGVALMTVLGERLAARIRTGDPAQLPFPSRPVYPIPLHPFWRLGVWARLRWGEVAEALWP